jgi:hypothetical protein
VTDLFIDGTFKSCSKHFFQLYTIHGGKNGHYLPLVFALLPSKSEQCYNKMWSLLINSCCERYLQLKPAVFHIDFERAMHNAITSCFPDTQIDCCRFHLGQKIQSLGLSKVYMDKSSEEGKWLSKFYGLSFLPPEYVEDIMSAAPNNNKCLQFADYVLAGCITDSSTFPPTMWAAVPDLTSKHTNNGPESFHSKLNAHFYASHPNIFLCVDVIKKMQATTYIKICAIDSMFTPCRCEMEKHQFAVVQFECYSKGEKTRSDFIKCLRYKFGTVTVHSRTYCDRCPTCRI